MDARRRAARLGVITSLFALLAGLASWQAIRVMRERNRSRRTEKALHEADQKLRLIANNLKEMVLACNMDQKLIYANSVMETLTGCSVDEYMKRGFIDWIHRDDRSRMLGQWDDLFRSGSYQDQEYHLVAKDGTVKWVSALCGPILDEAGRRVGV
jgi:two-component system, cell cycle sensor histidine kinase and response regulator CckA